MKKLLLAAAALALVATAPAFVGSAQAAPPYKPHPACSLPIPDGYAQSFKDRYNCWGYPNPYLFAHAPYYLAPVRYFEFAGTKWGPYEVGRATAPLFATSFRPYGEATTKSGRPRTGGGALIEEE